MTSNNSLPPDIHYDVRMLTQLFNKPRWRVSLQKRRRFEKGDTDNVDDVPWGDHFNPNNQNDQEQDNGHPSDDENADVFIEPPAIDGIELVDAPRKVEKIRVNYVKSAKVVDVKALKETIWSQLKEDQKTTKEPVPFSNILESLPQNIPSEAMENINVPFCFICLLHLANEKGLSIDQEKGNLSELTIHQ